MMAEPVMVILTHRKVLAIEIRLSRKTVSQLMGLKLSQVLNAGAIDLSGFQTCKKKRSDVQRKTTGAADEEHIGKI